MEQTSRQSVSRSVMAQSSLPSDEEILKMVQNGEVEQMRDILLAQEDSALVNRVKDWVSAMRRLYEPMQ